MNPSNTDILSDEEENSKTEEDDDDEIKSNEVEVSEGENSMSEEEEYFTTYEDYVKHQRANEKNKLFKKETVHKQDDLQNENTLRQL